MFHVRLLSGKQNGCRSSRGRVVWPAASICEDEFLAYLRGLPYMTPPEAGQRADGLT